jgi:hypothetical protein
MCFAVQQHAAVERPILRASCRRRSRAESSRSPITSVCFLARSTPA